MKILYLHQYFSTPKGAAGTRSYEMAKRLVAAGHEVTIVTGSSKIADTGLSGPYKKGRREGLIDGIHIIEFEIGYSNSTGFLGRVRMFLKFLWSAYRVVASSQYDLLFATSTPLTIAIPGIIKKLLFRDKRPFVLEIRDLWPELPRAMGAIRNPIIIKAIDILETLSYKAADRCIGLSPGMVEGIVRKGVPEEKVILIPNSSDVRLFQGEADTQLPDVIQQLLGSKNFVAVFAGAHGNMAGLRDILKAFKELQARGNTHIHGLFIGEGLDKPHLEAYAKTEKLANCTLSNGLPKLQIIEILRKADLGMMVFRNIPAFYYGTSPNKFFDYLAAGLPVLCNHPGWVTDLIQEHGCGVSVRPEDPMAFADALEALAKKGKKELTQMGSNSLELAKERFDRDKLGVDFVKWLEAAYEEAQG